MSVASGIICGWPSTAASIPSGWTRETSLDSKFLKCVPNSSTNPGTAGGNTTHSHTTAGHTHATTTHSHTYTGNSGATALSGSRRNTSGASYANPTHVHSLPAAVASATPGTSGSTSPNTVTQNNDPINIEVIWIKSDGTPAGFPNGALIWFNSDTMPPGTWSRHANSANRFCKGAAAAGNGGTQNAGNSSHTHTTAAHSHSVPSHTHAASGVSGQGSASTVAGGTGTGTALALGTHTHTFAAAAATHTTSTTVTAETASGSASSEPPYYKLNCISNGGTDNLPDKAIAVWTGTIATIPGSWALCDGGGTTPNLTGKYVKNCNANGELGTTGGSLTHTHTNPSTHTHAVDDASSPHSPTVGTPSTTQQTATSGGSANVATSGHTDHTGNTDAAGSTQSGTGTAGTYDTPNSEPAYVEVAFVQFTAPTGNLKRTESMQGLRVLNFQNPMESFSPEARP